jgi:hypothetical protein
MVISPSKYTVLFFLLCSHLHCWTVIFFSQIALQAGFTDCFQLYMRRKMLVMLCFQVYLYYIIPVIFHHIYKDGKPWDSHQSCWRPQFYLVFRTIVTTSATTLPVIAPMGCCDQCWMFLFACTQELAHSVQQPVHAVLPFLSLSSKPHFICCVVLSLYYKETQYYLHFVFIF